MKQGKIQKVEEYSWKDNAK
jgi:hypothetical protein